MSLEAEAFLSSKSSQDQSTVVMNPDIKVQTTESPSANSSKCFRRFLIAGGVTVCVVAAIVGIVFGVRRNSAVSEPNASASIQWNSVGSPTVFMHYLLTPVSSAQVADDISQISALGVDAIAVNQNTADPTQTKSLLDALKNGDGSCSLYAFVIFDMKVPDFTDPSKIITLIQATATHPCYYQTGGKPFVSAYRAGAVGFNGQQTSGSAANDAWKANVLDKLAPLVPYFVPMVEDANVDPSAVFSQFSSVDGISGWNTAWPVPSFSTTSFDDSADQTLVQSAQSAGKSYMMPLSTFQWKHNMYGNWLLPGELVFTQRINQILSAKPSFVQIVSWNDVGEGHNFGPARQEYFGPNDFITQETINYSHEAWQSLLKSFISAYKSGQSSLSTSGNSIVGAAWYRQIFLSDVCSSDQYPRPSIYPMSQDVLNVAVVLPKDSPITINTGTSTYQKSGVAGLNAFNVPLGRGVLSIQIGNGAPIATDPSKSVYTNCDGSNGIYNYNYQVLSLDQTIKINAAAKLVAAPTAESTSSVASAASTATTISSGSSATTSTATKSAAVVSNSSSSSSSIILSTAAAAPVSTAAPVASVDGTGNWQQAGGWFSAWTSQESGMSGGNGNGNANGWHVESAPVPSYGSAVNTPTDAPAGSNNAESWNSNQGIGASESTAGVQNYGNAIGGSTKSTDVYQVSNGGDKTVAPVSAVAPPILATVQYSGVQGVTVSLQLFFAVFAIVMN